MQMSGVEWAVLRQMQPRFHSLKMTCILLFGTSGQWEPLGMYVNSLQSPKQRERWGREDQGMPLVPRLEQLPCAVLVGGLAVSPLKGVLGDCFLELWGPFKLGFFFFPQAALLVCRPLRRSAVHWDQALLSWPPR